MKHIITYIFTLFISNAYSISFNFTVLKGSSRCIGDYIPKDTLSMFITCLYIILYSCI